MHRAASALPSMAGSPSGRSTRCSCVRRGIRRAIANGRHWAGCARSPRKALGWAGCPAALTYWRARACWRAIAARSTGIDRQRLSCAGGTAGLDLAIALIEARHGRDLATAVSDWYIRTQFRDASAQQRHSLRERLGTAHPAVLAAVATMEANIEESLSRTELARREGCSLRQLERLFAQHLGRTIAAEYRSIRLQRARSLLRETGMTAAEIASATGFSSFSHFSRAFRAEYGVSPSAWRNA